MGSGNTKGAQPDILVINHSESFDLTVDSSTRSSQTSLNSVAREKRRKSKMMSAEPTKFVDMPDVENVTKEAATIDNKDDKDAEKKIVQKLTEEQVLTKVAGIMPRLSCTKDYSTADCATDMTFLRKYSAHSSDNDRRVRYFDKLAELGVAPLFERVWKTHFTDSFTDENENELWNNMKCILIVMWNGTDRSKKLCQAVLDNKTYLPVIKWLKDPKLTSDMTKGTRECYTVKGFFGIIHNTLAQCDARHTFREAGIVQALIPFLQSPNLMIRTKTIINLAYLITEEEDHLINANDENFVLLVQILESCLEKKDRFSKKYGFWATEVLEVFNLLAVSDSNKEKIVNTGALPLYCKLLEQDHSSQHWESEQVNAAKGIWTLAFNDKIRKQILEMPSLMSGLSYLANNDGISESVERAAKGALWVLKGKDEQQRVLSGKDSKKHKRNEEENHIMISYNWGSKPTMLKVRDRLKAAGFNVWMDVDNMTGSTLEAMAKAVEKASVIIICMTQKYKESPSCRTEAEYTYKLRKPFIPLRLEFMYNPDGWLGIMIGTKLWFDFSMDTKFEPSLQGLIKEIHSGGSNQKQTVEPINHMPPTEHFQTQPPSQQTSTSQAAGWTKEQVKKWLIEKNLHDMTKKFQDFTGEDMMEMKFMLNTSPDFYYSSLRDNLKLSLLHILRFTKALKEI